MGSIPVCSEFWSNVVLVVKGVVHFHVRRSLNRNVASYIFPFLASDNLQSTNCNSDGMSIYYRKNFYHELFLKMDDDVDKKLDSKRI